jgi:hypothetical protein
VIGEIAFAALAAAAGPPSAGPGDRFLPVSPGQIVLLGETHVSNEVPTYFLDLAVRTVTVSSASAETWVCTGSPASCGVRRTNIDFCSGDPADAGRTRYYPSPDPRFAWDYCLSMPALTASLPASTPP